MRVIAGSLKGRTINTPKGHRTHPMAERVRGGLFNALGDISGLTILDAFAGSGALAIEAVSRGAKNVVAIDIDKKANDILRRNIDNLKVPNIKAINANAGGWSDKNLDTLFDIVFAAPPYDDIKLNLLDKLVQHVRPDGLYVLDWPGDKEIPKFEKLEKVSYKSYGDAALVFYRKTG